MAFDVRFTVLVVQCVDVFAAHKKKSAQLEVEDSAVYTLKVRLNANRRVWGTSISVMLRGTVCIVSRVAIRLVIFGFFARIICVLVSFGCGVPGERRHGRHRRQAHGW